MLFERSRGFHSAAACRYSCPALQPHWSPTNCFSVDLSAPDLHQKAQPTTEQEERFASWRSPLTTLATSVAKEDRPTRW